MSQEQSHEEIEPVETSPIINLDNLITTQIKESSTHSSGVSNLTKITQEHADVPDTPNFDRIKPNKATIGADEITIESDKARIASNNSRIASNQAKIASNKARMASNKARIALNQARIVSDKARMASNKTRIASNQARLAYYQAVISSNQARIASNQSRIVSKQARMCSNQTRISRDHFRNILDNQRINTNLTSVGVQRLFLYVYVLALFVFFAIYLIQLYTGQASDKNTFQTMCQTSDQNRYKLNFPPTDKPLEQL